jgi:hypothetical protein
MIHKIGKNLLKFGRFIINNSLAGIEKIYLANTKDSCKYPPIFIIGVPRTGTTLLYQSLIKKFKFSYIPNISNYLFKVPVSAAKIGKIFFPKYDITFQSSYGNIKGLMASSEAGSVWNRWFLKDNKRVSDFSIKEKLDKDEKKYIYSTVKGFESIFNLPFLNKNTFHSVRIALLSGIFPKALFIQMRRNPVNVAISILHGRRENNKDISKWWSVTPKEINNLKEKNYLDQVVGQIYYIEKNIQESIDRVGKDKLLQINYENLCEDPEKEMLEIKKFTKKNQLELIENTVFLNGFKESSSEKNVSEKEKKLLKEKLCRLNMIDDV